MRGKRSDERDVGGGNERVPSKWFDSATTRSDFSNTFHSLIVLSVCFVINEKVRMMSTDHLWIRESEQNSAADTI